MYGNLLYLIARNIDNIKDFYEFKKINKKTEYYCERKDIEKRESKLKSKYRMCNCQSREDWNNYKKYYMRECYDYINYYGYSTGYGNPFSKDIF